MNKKALSMQTLAVIILVLIFLVGMLFFQQKFFKELPSYKSKIRCKASVEANALLRLRHAEFSPGVDCDTEFISIKSEKQAKQIMAEQMADCWDTFGRGKLNLFSDDSRYCFICSIIDFETPKSFTQIKGFYEFMFNSRMPRSRETYMDFITNENSQSLLDNLKQQDINLGQEALPVQKYAVYFIYDKGEDFVKKDISNLLTPKFTISSKTAPPITGKFITGAAIIIPAVMIITFAGMAITHIIELEKDVTWRSAIILDKYDSQKLQQLECTENLPKS